jgi:hypothetical protein
MNAESLEYYRPRTSATEYALPAQIVAVISKRAVREAL